MMLEIYGKRDGHLPGQGRLDAHRRLRQGHARRQRHRRRRPAARLRRRPVGQGPRHATRSASRSSATAAPTRARSSRASTSRASGTCRCVFVVENNGYAEATSSHFHQHGRRRRQARRRLRPARAWSSTGTTSSPSTRRPARRSRAPATGGGPTLIECKVNRYYGHFEGDAQTYRGPGEVEDVRRDARLPRRASRAASPRPGSSSATTSPRSTRRSRQLIDEAVAEAKAAPDPTPRRTCSPTSTSPTEGASHGARRSPTSRPSTRRSRRRWSATRRSSCSARTSSAAPARPGEDDAWGGVLGVTKGLYGQFPDRILDTPISESAFIGAAVGAAASGLRPVAELMFVDFMGVCFDQIFNQGGEVPLHVRRQGEDAGRDPHDVRAPASRAAAQHSQALYPLFTHIPGLKVVDPLEPLRREGPADPGHPRRRPGHLLREQGPLPDRGRRARGAVRASRSARRTIVREGDDVTIVAIGRMVSMAEQAAERPRRRRHRVRDRRPAHDLAARRGDDLRERREHGPARRRRRVQPALLARRRHRRARRPEVLRRAQGAAADGHGAAHAAPFTPVLEDAYVPSADRIAAAVRDVAGAAVAPA